jgi:hypothetical protein
VEKGKGNKMSDLKGKSKDEKKKGDSKNKAKK